MKSVISALIRWIAIVITLFVLSHFYDVHGVAYLLVASTHILWYICGYFEDK